ncbi:amidohydrolase family protein [Croceicoccus sp. F390]|uniref:Amidohydrolase family protein n=1 Tax=Croceicoccus esteveae TaxID=3075597 RepID=A0ABU2ZF24_9SPHN|nr:amidohydrolase family protein [Croceicoccus sp. F390]MDT0575195.1 amidohydrolase family protein [Croceicoccus sp. F390]
MGRRRDVRIRAGQISEIGQLRPSASEQVLDAAGGALLPGLHDHHIHLNACAAARQSVSCGPPDVASAEDLVAVLVHAPGTGWLRGIGWHASATGEIDRHWLDRHGPDRPIRIQHRGGRMWIVNSLAMEQMQIAEPADGRLIDHDAALAAARTQVPDLATLGRELLRYGITGVTDVTPRNDDSDAEHYARSGMAQRIAVMAGPQMRDGGSSGLPVVARKLHYHDHDLPSLARLVTVIAAEHERDRPVAAHCVTQAELWLTLAAMEEAGCHAGDRIEHAAICDEEALATIRRLGITVVTQPLFLQERQAAYRSEVPGYQHADLWRLGSFLRHGVALAAGSDAPFGGIDPWHAMAAACRRPEGFGTDEAISPEAALALYTKPLHHAGAPPRQVSEEAQADLCLLTQAWGAVRQDLAGACVRATIAGGRLVYQLKASNNPHEWA